MAGYKLSDCEGLLRVSNEEYSKKEIYNLIKIGNRALNIGKTSTTISILENLHYQPKIGFEEFLNDLVLATPEWVKDIKTILDKGSRDIRTYKACIMHLILVLELQHRVDYDHIKILFNKYFV